LGQEGGWSRYGESEYQTKYIQFSKMRYSLSPPLCLIEYSRATRSTLIARRKSSDEGIGNIMRRRTVEKREEQQRERERERERESMRVSERVVGVGQPRVRNTRGNGGA
jgi:hypothetical protein